MEITLKIPDEIGLTEEEVKEWVSVLVERKENFKLQPPQDKVLTAQTRIDTFREQNNLKKKFEQPQEEVTRS